MSARARAPCACVVGQASCVITPCWSEERRQPRHHFGNVGPPTQPRVFEEEDEEDPDILRHQASAPAPFTLNGNASTRAGSSTRLSVVQLTSASTASLLVITGGQSSFRELVVGCPTP